MRSTQLSFAHHSSLDTVFQIIQQRLNRNHLDGGLESGFEMVEAGRSNTGNISRPGGCVQIGSDTRDAQFLDFGTNIGAHPILTTPHLPEGHQGARAPRRMDSSFYYRCYRDRRSP